MMSLSEFTRKPVITISPEATIHKAALLMKEKNLGCIVVVDKNFPIGILTDRDITIKAVADSKDLRTTAVQEIMTKNPVVLRQDLGVFEALEQVKDKGMRRFPIVDSGGRLTGIVTVDDLICMLGKELYDISLIIEKEKPRL